MPLRTAIHEDNDDSSEAVLAAHSGSGGRMQTGGAAISNDDDYDWLVVELKPDESMIVVASRLHLAGWHFVRVERQSPGPATLHLKRQRPTQTKAKQE
jgi:hypothetical protein